MRTLTSGNTKMKKSSLALLTTALALGGSGLWTTAQAADSADSSGGGGGGSACCTTLTAAINNMGTLISTTVSTGFSVLTTQINDLVQAGVDFSSTLASNTAYQTVITNNWVNTDASNYGKTATQQAFQASSANANATLTKSSAIVAGISSGASPQSSTSGSTAPALNSFTMNTLLGNSVLTTDQVTAAQSYIQFLAGTGNPVQTLPANTAAAATGPVKAFLSTLGSYVATQSAGMSVLYKALAVRSVEPGLGPTANLPDNISPLKLQETMVTTPLSQTWYDSMNKANPADIQKQTLFLLANMQNLMYQNGLQLEQLNVTLATLQLQMLEGLTRQNLQTARAAAMNTPTASPTS